MNPESSPDDLISLPNSYVKAPGFLLKDKKRPGEVVSNQKLIRSLFLTVEQPKRNSVCSMSILSGSFLSSESSPLGSDLTSEESSPLINSVKSLSPKSLSRIGRLSVDYDFGLALKRSKDILFVYGIELEVLPHTENSKDAFDVLRSLIPEICSFRYGFFKKLQLNRLIICADQTIETSRGQKRVLFVAENLTTEEKIHKRLYQIIIDHLAATNSRMFDEWKITEENKGLQQDYLKKMEESFFILMKNSNSSIIKNELKTLKELLTKYYPSDMPEDWFSQRKKAKKRMLRVSFDFRSK